VTEAATPSAPRPANGAQRDFAIGAAFLVALLLWADGGRRVALDWLAVMTIGGGVGWVEILGRYRYAPVRATLTASAGAYVLVNIAAAAVAYYLIPFFVDALAVANTPKLVIQKVLLAGFGALAFLRSSLFKFRVGDADIGVGPAALLDTLLLVADRGVDRREAVSRAQDVSALVKRVKDPRLVAKMLTQYCLALMQNVDQNTQATIADAIDKILEKKDTPESILIDLVALRLGVVVGPDVLEAAVVALGDRLAATPAVLSGAGGATGAGDAPPKPGATPTAQQAAFKAELERENASPPAPGAPSPS
jgi:hypothetical protein